MSEQVGAGAGTRITKVGLWFCLLAFLVGVAATNTGNNSLYMVLATMVSALAVSLLAAKLNLSRLLVEVHPPVEVFANQPARMRYTLANRSRLLPRWLIQLSIDRGPGELAVHLPRRGGGVSPLEGEYSLLLRRRGPALLRWVSLSTLFPFGFFRVSRRQSIDLRVLVYPEIFSAASMDLEEPGYAGEAPTRRVGWGHDLHALRELQPGDDPRGIHWKQTARTGQMIFREREAEESRTLSIVLDNAVGPLEDEAAVVRFERLVSEAATAALDYLERGYEVELITRDEFVPLGAGLRQRDAILECLALIEVRPAAHGPLAGELEGATHLRLALDAGRESAAPARPEAAVYARSPGAPR